MASDTTEAKHKEVRTLNNLLSTPKYGLSTLRRLDTYKLILTFRHGWKKLYIVVSSRKIIMFNSEQDRQNSDPTLILDLNKVG